jgi:hypothetical protein
MYHEADALQAKYLHLATEHDEHVNAKLHPTSRMHMTLEQQAMYLMEFMHRIAPHPHLATLCWVVVHGDSHPCPIGLVPPSQWSNMTAQLREPCVAAHQLRTCGPDVLAQARALN